MTKPHNFPGRKNARRRSALDRIERQLASGVRHNSGCDYPLAADDLNRLEREANTLGLRVTPAGQSRAIHTKKLKALGWSAARTAVRSGRFA